jgi:hypothetical protein
VTEVVSLRARVIELEDHEDQTHKALGKILGTDISLEEGARRLSDSELKFRRQVFELQEDRAVWKKRCQLISDDCLEVRAENERLSGQVTGDPGYWRDHAKDIMESKLRSDSANVKMLFDLTRQVTDWVGKERAVSVELTDARAELDTLYIKIAELKKHEDGVVEHAVEMLGTSPCEVHAQHIASLSFDAFCAEEKAYGCLRCAVDRAISAETELTALRRSMTALVKGSKQRETGQG